MNRLGSSPPAWPVALLLLAVGAPGIVAQGALDPAGSPEPGMKTLQEIWDKLAELDAKVEELAAVIGSPVAIEMVTVGNTANAGDTEGDPNPAGAVAYAYQIGKFEVTNAEYVEFLNAVAAADPNGLYNPTMGSDVRGGITQSGTSPDFSYSIRPNMGNKPVSFVSWYDALRFCNWLHNGQPSGPQDGSTTEDGAYTLTAPTTVATGTDPTHGSNGRNAGAKYHLPGDDEWYKAAYHEPGADTNDYWLYPTRSNAAPTAATADLFGNINNDAANIANHNRTADWNGSVQGNLTTVGSGGPGSASFYGAFDMGGNVTEWTEQAVATTNRVARGGNRGSSASILAATFRSATTATAEDSSIGFRIASP